MSRLQFIVLLTVLGHIAFSGSRVAVALAAIHLQASPFTVGTLVALYAFLPALLSIAAGRLVDRVGIRIPFIAGSFVAAIGTLTPFAWNSINALYLASSLIGAGFMVITVSVYQAVGELSTPEQRPANFSLLALGFSMGGLCGPLLAGFAIDHLSFARSFLLLSVFAVIPALALTVSRVTFPRPHGHVERPSDAAVIDLLRNPDLRRIYIAVAFFSLSWDVYNFAVPLYGAHIGLSASQIGLIMGSFALATLVIRLLVPVISRHFKPWRLLMISSLAAATSYFIMPLTSSVLALIVLLFLLGLGLGAPQPLVLSLLHEAAPPGRGGEAVGLRILLINLSQTTMPLLFGFVGATLGIFPVFWTAATCLLMGSWLARKSTVTEAHAGARSV